MHIRNGIPADQDCIHSIRQQSEAVYAVLHYLVYEKKQGRQHKEWEAKMRTLLNQMLLLQKADGSFPRKYRDDHTDVDASGGSTPSATSTLVMGYKYFGDKRYLAAAKRTISYLEENIISKSDYFSSTRCQLRGQRGCYQRRYCYLLYGYGYKETGASALY